MLNHNFKMYSYYRHIKQKEFKINNKLIILN